jgi:hypothetical protein
MKYIVIKGQRTWGAGNSCEYNLHSIFSTKLSTLNGVEFSTEFLNSRRGTGKWEPDNWTTYFKTIYCASKIPSERRGLGQYLILENLLTNEWYGFINEEDLQGLHNVKYTVHE